MWKEGLVIISRKSKCQRNLSSCCCCFASDPYQSLMVCLTSSEEANGFYCGLKIKFSFKESLIRRRIFRVTSLLNSRIRIWITNHPRCDFHIVGLDKFSNHFVAKWQEKVENEQNVEVGRVKRKPLRKYYVDLVHILHTLPLPLPSHKKLLTCSLPGNVNSQQFVMKSYKIPVHLRFLQFISCSPWRREKPGK